MRQTPNATTSQSQAYFHDYSFSVTGRQMG